MRRYADCIGIIALGQKFNGNYGNFKYANAGGGKLITVKENYELGDNINSKVLAFAFGLSAEVERTLISARTREALARKKAEGITLGRPKGKNNNTLKLTPQKEYINEMLRENMAVGAIAKRLQVHRSTLTCFLKRKSMS